MVSAPNLAQVGHGDVRAASGSQPCPDGPLGIQVAPIEPATDGASAVLVPAVSLVEADGNTFAFVEYEAFYELYRL